MKFTHWFVQLLLGMRKFPGRDFLIEKSPKWFLKQSPDECEVQTRFGFKILIHPKEDPTIEQLIYERGVYELGTVSVLQQYLKPGDCFVDVGANIGFLTLVASNIVGPNGKVISFEPVTSHFKQLEENINRNNIANVDLRQHALGNQKEEKTIFLEKDNKGGASLVVDTGHKGESIKVERWDDLNINGPIHMIKIDVEGYEWEVLKGCKETILKDKPILIVEYSSDRNNSGNSIDMYRWIVDLGIYEAYRLERGKDRPSRLVPIKSKTVGLPVHDNIFCLPINR